MMPAFQWLVHGAIRGHGSDFAATYGRDMIETLDLRAERARQRGRIPFLVFAVRELGALYWGAAVERCMTLRGPARDVRVVCRGLRRGAFAALAAAAMLSAGLLAVVLTVGLARTLLLRQVSATHGDAVRRVAAVDREGHRRLGLAFTELTRVRTRIADAGDLTAVVLQPVVIRADGTDIQTMVEVVDGSYFHVTGIDLLIGRGLSAFDDRAATSPAIVLAERFWRRRFGAAPSILGSVVHLNGSAFGVIGVASSLGSSSFLGASVDGWIPAMHADPVLDRNWRTDPMRRLFTAFLLPRTSDPEITARLDGAAADLRDIYPEAWRDRRVVTAPGSVLVGSQRRTVMMLTAVLGGLAALILTTAAANLSGVLLARAAVSRRQAAIHLSMGSGRAALVRRQLIEGAVIGIAAGVMSLAMYAWARASLAEIALLPTLALRLDLPFDAGLVTAIVLAGALTGVLLAVGPALWTARVDLAGALRDSEWRGGDGRGLTRMRRALVSAQVALTLVLIAGATLFSRSLSAMADADLGFPRDGIVAVDFDLEPAAARVEDLPVFAREALLRVRALPGVTAAAMSNRAPVDVSTPAFEVRAASATGAAVADVTFATITSGYFEALGLPLVDGRSFTAFETDAGADLAIVNESLARQLWPGDSAIGRGLYLVVDRRTVRVVGVARDSKYREITERGRPHLYLPTPPKLGLSLIARTTADPQATLRAIQEALHDIGPGLVGFFPRTQDEHLVVQLLPTRTAAGAAALLGSVALVLSAVGLYGLVSWFVAQRRREIGVRMALGASPRDIRSMVVGQALRAAMPGLVAGSAGAVGLGLTTRSLLFGVAPVDPVALGAGIATLLLVTLVAGYAPGRRAARSSPSETLRQ
jgi:putative ABC transport system permease protein